MKKKKEIIPLSVLVLQERKKGSEKVGHGKGRDQIQRNWGLNLRKKRVDQRERERENVCARGRQKELYRVKFSSFFLFKLNIKKNYFLYFFCFYILVVLIYLFFLFEKKKLGWVGNTARSSIVVYRL